MNDRTIKLGEVIKINQNNYSNIDSYEFVNYLDTGNITNNTINKIQFINLNYQKLPSRAKRKVNYNSIIYSMVRPNQRHFGIIKSVPNNFLVSTGFAVIDVDKNLCDADYIYYYLTQNKVIEKLQSIAEQSVSTYPSIKPSDLENMNIILPSLEKQKKISQILLGLDNKINLINDNLEKQLHQLFLYFFTNCIPSVALGDIVETTSGGTPSRKHIEYYKNGTICWVKSKELLSNYIHNTEEHISDLALSKSSAKLLPKHSVLIAMYGATVGAYGIISRPMACNQAVCALLCNEKYPYTYLFQIAKEFQQKLVGMAVGSAQQNISQVLIKQLHLHSDIDTINNFHILAYPLHKKIEYLQAENIILGKTRDAILSKLMSGEIDVSNIDI